LAYRDMNKLSKFIKIYKDKLPKDSHTNVMYKINCMNCDASYVGQTGRLLKTRIGKHRNHHINRNTAQLSVISEHRIEFSHEFNWGETMILNKEPNNKYLKCYISTNKNRD